jgi:hypothetical protein
VLGDFDFIPPASTVAISFPVLADSELRRLQQAFIYEIRSPSDRGLDHIGKGTLLNLQRVFFPAIIKVRMFQKTYSVLSLLNLSVSGSPSPDSSIAL